MQRMTLANFVTRRQQQTPDASNEINSDRRRQQNFDEGTRSLDIEVDVNVETKQFDLRCKVRSSRDNVPVSTDIRNISIDNKGSWNFLMLHFKENK